jgi:Kef-type K+ transport system membrane component KefB
MQGFATPGIALLSGGGESAKILLALFMILVAAKLLAELFERLRQPAVIGEILAGVLIGPSLLNFIHPIDAGGLETSIGVVVESLANIGVIFLLFTVGLETRPSDLFKVGKLATSVAAIGAAIPFFTGWALIYYWPGGHSNIEAIFTGAAMVSTSVGITARVLSGLGLVTAEASRVILAAAVIDDVIGLLVLAVVSSLATGQVNVLQIIVTALLAIGFTIFVVLVGAKAVNKLKPAVTDLKINHSLFIFSLLLCFGLAAVANFIGIAGIVGAFLAGVAFSEATDDTDLHNQAQTLTEFTTPFFLVNIGLKLNLAVFLSPKILLLSLVVTVLAIVTKFFGCGLPALRMGKRRAIQIGVGMAPRGEVGIVVAQLGLSLAAVSDAMYAVVLFMAVATTLTAPPLIKLAFSGEERLDQIDDGRELQFEIQ